MRHILLALLCLGLLTGCQESHAQLMMMSSTAVSASLSDYTADANCMGAWFMNNNGGNETDRSGSGETLTQTSGTIPTSATVPGGYGGTSRDFADSEWLQHADSGSTDINGADQDLSIVAWFKYGATPTGDDAIVSKYYVTGNHRQYKLQFRNTDSALCGYVSSNGESGGTSKVIGATDINDTNWHHGALVYNDTDIRIYLDGSLDSNGADNPKAHTTGIANKDGLFGVGANPDTYGEVFDGLIDEVGIFDKALSAAEVSAIYTDGLDGTKGGND